MIFETTSHLWLILETLWCSSLKAESSLAARPSLLSFLQKEHLGTFIFGFFYFIGFKTSNVGMLISLPAFCDHCPQEPANDTAAKRYAYEMAKYKLKYKLKYKYKYHWHHPQMIRPPRDMHRSWPSRGGSSRPLGKHWRVSSFQTPFWQFDWSYLHKIKHLFLPKVSWAKTFTFILIIIIIIVAIITIIIIIIQLSCKPGDKQWPTPRTPLLAASMSPPKRPGHHN